MNLEKQKFRHGSLFSGQGGFDLAAQWMDWENVFHCEWNPFGQRILKYYWPLAKSFDDITKSDFTFYRGKIDILSGGFPCQPYSAAGKRLGKEDDRHLWPEMLRAIREIQPRWVVGENVRGLTNWNGGLVFDEVQADLEAAGYEVTPFLLPACAVNAPHRRDRIWFVAHAPSERRGEEGECFGGSKEWVSGKISNTSYSDEFDGDVSGLYSGRISQQQTTGLQQHPTTNSTSQRREEWIKNRRFKNSKKDRKGIFFQCERSGDNGISSNADRHQRRKRRLYASKRKEAKRYVSAFNSRNDGRTWENFPTQPPVCTGNDGLPPQLDGITVSKWRTESIKAAGNAIVPQVALQIFKSIQAYENL